MIKQQHIADFIYSLGFDDVGFGEPALPEEDNMLTAANCGDMDWLYETYEIRKNPKNIFPQAQTVIVVGSHLGQAPFDDRYKGKRSQYQKHLQKQSNYGQIAQYAKATKDYHIWIKKRLKQACRWLAENYQAEARPYVDTAPINERFLAAEAGLGWIGKHGLLVSPKFGSKLILGVILTDLNIEKSPKIPNQCGRCERCQKACPTNALDIAYQLNIPHCISYLTIEHKGEIAEELHPFIGKHIFGCDECISACPYNRGAPPCQSSMNLPRIELDKIYLDDIAVLNEEDFREIFASTPLKRTGHARMLRNVKIAKAQK
ncbi:MAG: tRNA epoxyqueuosine(34) reductase QueG [Alphaproteobacteria bacterium]